VRNTAPITADEFSHRGGRNDCEPVVRARFAAVAEALDWLRRLAPAQLTGTGSCIFAGFDRAIDAERIAAQVPDRWRSFVARGLDRSPLHRLLEPADLRGG
jgi:4-diphosphocytidyl-2-C-methyl-D-erythritol kinase